MASSPPPDPAPVPARRLSRGVGVAMAAAILLAIGPMPWTRLVGGERIVDPVVVSEPLRGVTQPQREAGGQLILREAWQLRSRDTEFGGFSGMVVEGPRSLALFSDTGRILRLHIDRDGRLSRVRHGRLLKNTGDQAGKFGSDIEAATRDPVTGRTWIATELWYSVRRLDDALVRIVASRRPAAIAAWPTNGGAESLVRLRDGRFLIVSERGWTHERREALLYPADPTIPGPDRGAKLSLVDPGFGAPTDAALVDRDRILLLHRKIGLRPLFSAAVTSIDVADVRPGAVLTATPVARLGPTGVGENMEAMAVEREGARTFVWIASDDNLNVWQRTILLRYEWIAPQPRTTPGVHAKTATR